MLEVLGVGRQRGVVVLVELPGLRKEKMEGAPTFCKGLEGDRGLVGA